MKKAALFSIVIIVMLAAGSQADTSQWTYWRDTDGVKGFTYRWRLSEPCQGKNCSIEVQIRNNSETRKSVNYTVTFQTDEGNSDQSKDHWNFDPHEVLSVTGYGSEVSGVIIDRS